MIDDYCQCYQSLFSDVRNYKYFKYLHLGLISEIKRKSLTQLSKVLNISSEELHHFFDLFSHNYNKMKNIKF